MAFKIGTGLLFAAGVAALAGCDGSGTAMTAMSAQRSDTAIQQFPVHAARTNPDLKGVVIYLSNIDGQPGLGNVYVYPSNLGWHGSTPIRVISQGTVRPWGEWVDGNGTLYVAHIPQGAPTTGVSEFHPGASVPFQYLTDALQDPTAVAVAKDGTVYVNQAISDAGYVTVYPPGSTVASTTLNLNFGGYAFGAGQMAFAKNGDLLVVDSTFKSGSHVFRITPGTFAVRDLGLNLPSEQASGLAVDPAGNVYFGWTAYARHELPTRPVSIFVSRSADGGRTWNTSLLDVSSAPPDCDAQSCETGYLGPQIALASDAAGALYALWNSGAANGGPERIYFSSSTTGGASWSERANVSHAAAGVEHSFPRDRAGRHPPGLRVCRGGAGRSAVRAGRGQRRPERRPAGWKARSVPG